MWQSHFWLQFKINWTAHTVFKITEPQCLDSWNKNIANKNLLSHRIRKRMSSYKEKNIILKGTHCLSLGAFSSPVPARLLTLTLSLLPFACGRRTPLSVYATSDISPLEKGLLLFLEFVLMWRDSKVIKQKNPTWPVHLAWSHSLPLQREKRGSK